MPEASVLNEMELSPTALKLPPLILRLPEVALTPALEGTLRMPTFNTPTFVLSTVGESGKVDGERKGKAKQNKTKKRHTSVGSVDRDIGLCCWVDGINIDGVFG